MRFRIEFTLLAAAISICASAYPNTSGRCLFSCGERLASGGIGATNIYLTDLNTGVTISLCRLDGFEATSAVVDPGWKKALITGYEAENRKKSFLLSFNADPGVGECSVSDIIDGIFEEDREPSYGSDEKKTFIIARTVCGGESIGNADIWFSLGDIHYEGVCLGERVLNSVDYSVKCGAFAYFIRGEEVGNRISLQLRYPDGEIVNSFELPSAVKAENALGTNIKFLYVE